MKFTIRYPNAALGIDKPFVIEMSHDEVNRLIRRLVELRVAFEIEAC